MESYSVQSFKYHPKGRMARLMKGNITEGVKRGGDTKIAGKRLDFRKVKTQNRHQFSQSWARDLLSRLGMGRKEGAGRKMRSDTTLQ